MRALPDHERWLGPQRVARALMLAKSVACRGSLLSTIPHSRGLHIPPRVGRCVLPRLHQGVPRVPRQPCLSPNPPVV